MTHSRWLTICVAACLAAGCTGHDKPGIRDSAETRHVMIPDTIRQELTRLGDEDQAIREGAVPERLRNIVFVTQMLREDSARTARLHEIVGVYGWPDSVRAGSQASKAAFLILQHSPVHEFQREMLPTIEAMARGGVIRRDEAALLVDRVLVHERLPQRYGTQFSMRGDRLVMDSVEDPAHLEERRRSMGLPTMDEYMRVLAQVYQAEVAR